MNKILRNGLFFLGIWFAVMVVYSLFHDIPSFDYFWKFSILPGLVLASIAIVASLFQQYTTIRKRINWIFVIVALGLDQGIKGYLFSLDWENISKPIIAPVFYLEPTQNTLGSYLWVLLGLSKSSHLLNVILFSVIGLLFVEIWRFYVDRKRTSVWIKGFIQLFIAGLVANIIDNAFWGGSLDYITIRPFYTFDLKDMYITLCELFLITELLDNKLLKKLFKMPKEESNRLNKDFRAFVMCDVRGLLRKVGIGRKE